MEVQQGSMEVRKGLIWTGHRGGMCRYGDTGVQYGGTEGGSMDRAQGRHVQVW